MTTILNLWNSMNLGMKAMAAAVAKPMTVRVTCYIWDVAG